MCTAGTGSPGGRVNINAGTKPGGGVFITGDLITYNQTIYASTIVGDKGGIRIASDADCDTGGITLDATPSSTVAGQVISLQTGTNALAGVTNINSAAGTMPGLVNINAVSTSSAPGTINISGEW